MSKDTKIIFIDRDGVINKDLWRYVETPDEFEFLPGVLEALKLLHENGYKVVVISNQAGVGDGKFSSSDLAAVNEKFLSDVAGYGGLINSVYYCIHGKYEGCGCRKPEIGLFEEAEGNLGNFEKEKTYYIGDKLTDILAGKRYGLRTILVMTGYGEKEKGNITEENRPDYFADDLLDAVKNIVLTRTANA